MQRIHGIQEKLINQSNTSDDILRLGFMFVSNDGELAMLGYYAKDHGEEKLYAGHFHRFVAYGLWIEEHVCKP
ncbi:MAG: hypothetical protein ACFFDT_29915, partial [Candidatus Hodarchaeota archaeon]